MGELGKGTKPVQASASRRRILVVDDQPFFLSACQQALRGRGYEVQTATGGAEALKAIESARPDLILLDIEMPGADGFATCRRIKANPATAHIPVAMVSASEAPKLVQQAFQAGAQGTIPKNMGWERLLNMIDLILAQARPLSPAENPKPGPTS
jgi:CheY-like chemotaxis protein